MAKAIKGLPKEFVDSNRYDHLIGKHYTRKFGKVVYKVVGGLADYSYQHHYNFVIYFVVFERVSPGPGKRGKGTRTTAPDSEFRYDWKEVDCE